MDQVKKVMGILMAQRFWVICGLITILPLGGWFTTTSNMRKTTQERKQLIDGKFKDAQDLNSKPDPPNDTSHTEMEKLVEELKRRVGDAWGMQYDQQKNLLVWPAELGPDFLQAVAPLNPIERVSFPTPPSDELKVHLRERYRDYIKRELPKLADIIGAKWTVNPDAVAAMAGGMGGMPGMEMGGMPGAMPGMAGGASGGFGGYPGGAMPGDAAGGMMGGMGMMTDPVTGQPVMDDSKVLWSNQDQTSLMARYDWRSHPDKAPRTLDVLYAQEDLWVMTSLMHIIAEANQGSTGRYNSVIKEIQYVTIGAGGTVGRITPLRGMMGAGGMPGGYGDMGMMGMMGMDAGAMPGMEGGVGGEAATLGMMPGMEGAAEGGMPGMMMPGMEAMPGMEGMAGMAMGPRDPANRRYVDLDYKPISGESVRSAIVSDAQDEEAAYLLVAKRIPIRLGLTVDQRKLNRFISACGNSKLMFEVRQVRFNRQSGASGGMGMSGYGGMADAGMAGGMPGMMPGAMPGDAGLPGGGMPGGFGGAGFGGAMPGMEGGYGGMSMGGYGQSGRMNDVTANDKPVEVFGVVYIYNPVDVKKLRLEEAAAAAAAAAAGEAPVAAPPAASETGA